MYDVSVIVTVFNSEEYLEECILSLMGQEGCRLEIILINDGSGLPKDDEICKRFSNANSHVKYIDLINNHGTGYAREVGVKASQGKYIGFLDSDDIASKDCYATLFNAASYYNADIAVGNYSSGSSRGYTFESIDEPATEVLSGELLFHTQINRYKRPYYLRVDWWNKIYRRSLFNKNEFSFPKVVRNEGTLSMIMSLLSKNAVIIDAVMFYSQNRVDSVCRSFRDKNIKDCIDSSLHFKKWLFKISGDKYFESYIGFFPFVVYNHNLKLILKLDKEERNRKIDLLMSSIESSPDFYSDFICYLNRPEQRTERLVYSTLKSKKFYPILSEIKSTDFSIRKESGKRLSVSKRDLTKKPLVTVITIAKDIVKNDRCSFFKKMVDTVANQTIGRAKIEHIVIDALSEDGSMDFYNEFKGKSEIDYILSEKDTGVYNAMNKAILLGRGDYFLFLNSDDYLEYNAIEKLHLSLVDNDADYAFANAYKVDESENKVGSHIGNINKVYFGTPYCHQTILISKTALNAVPYDESFRITMWLWSLTLYLKGFRCAHVPEKLAYFRVGGLSTDISNSKEFKAEQDHIKKNYIVNNLNITYEEYEYLNHTMRKWDTSWGDYNLEDIIQKLKSTDQLFVKDFLNCFYELVG